MAEFRKLKARSGLLSVTRLTRRFRLPHVSPPSVERSGEAWARV
jgi:hypothetical protein